MVHFGLQWESDTDERILKGRPDNNFIIIDMLRNLTESTWAMVIFIKQIRILWGRRMSSSLFWQELLLSLLYNIVSKRLPKFSKELLFNRACSTYALPSLYYRYATIPVDLLFLNVSLSDLESINYIRRQSYNYQKWQNHCRQLFPQRCAVINGTGESNRWAISQKSSSYIPLR